MLDCLYSTALIIYSDAGLQKQLRDLRCVGVGSRSHPRGRLQSCLLLALLSLGGEASGEQHRNLKLQVAHADPHNGPSQWRNVIDKSGAEIVGQALQCIPLRN